MWIIIDYQHGNLDFACVCVDIDGNCRQWNTEREAQTWANNNCAFGYVTAHLN